METWKDVVGYEGFYAVSDAGRVRSVDRMVHHRGQLIKLVGKMLALQTAVVSKNYRRVSVGLSKEGRVKCRLVSVLVAAAFHGPCPDGLEVLHGNGDPTDNRAENLRYGTHAENGKDTVAHGSAKRGERHWNSSLTTDDVLAIRGRCQAGDLQADVAGDFGVSPHTVSRIVSGKRWGWLTAASR